MSKKGVSKISGNPSPKIGEVATYAVTDWYPATPQAQRNVARVTWELFKKRENGRFTTTNIKKTGTGTFTFGEVAHRHTYRIEAYLYESEGDGASTIEINPQPTVIPRINKVELKYVDDTPGTTFSYTEKLVASAETVNLGGEKLKFSLWEDDAAGNGHNSRNLLIETKEATVNRQGTATAEFMLTRALMQKAMQGETDPGKLEFYVTVEYFSHNKHATNNVHVDNPLHTPPRPQPRPQTNNRPVHPAHNQNGNTPPRAQNSPAAEKPQSQMEEKGILDTVTDWWNGLELWDWGEAAGTIEPTQPPTQQPAGGRTVSIVQDSAVEDLLDAYFAEKEYTRQTGEAAGTFEYNIGSNGNKTSTDAEKENIAKIILAKPEVKALAAKKEYTTLEAIKQALTKEVYNKDEKVTFQTFKLGAEFKKINSAPLEAKVYLVARTSGLNGKQATIIIKEKDGLIKGSAGAILPVLEITEAQMEQASASGGEVQGTEKTEFTATIENGIAKVPVHLRPKSDDELKQWKEKVSKGKEEGEYTYKFGGTNNITDENSKKTIAETILKNSKSGNSNNEKIEEGKSAYLDDIIKVLEIKTYLKDQTIKFKLYKKEKELLYLQAKAQGEKQHDKEFLKADGAYFMIGKKCECEERIRAFMRTIRIAEGTGEYIKGSHNARDPQLGYTTWFSGGGNNFSDLSTHPQTINCNSTNTLCSSASGAYQIMGWKFDELNGYLIQIHNDTYKTVKPHVYTEATDLAKKYNAKGFSEVAQDRLCLIILKQKNIITSILQNNIEEAIDKAKGTWVSLPGATAGQPTAKMQETLDYYNEFFAKEISGQSNLHLEKGFLKEFGYECQCDNSSSSSWHDPIDNPEITLYNYYGNYNPAGSSFGKVRNGGTKNHQGLDIFAPSGTAVKACLDGKVVIADENDGNWGKLIVIEVKKDDLDNARRNYTLQYTGEIEKGTNYDSSNQRFLRYAHLSEISVTNNQEVKAGDTIGLSGKTGNAENQNVRARHLHFDIANVKNAGTGTSERENPAFYVRLVPADDDRQKNNTD